MTLEQALSIVARTLETDVVQDGNLWFLGQIRPEDKGILVRRIRRLTPEEAAAAVSGLASANGRVLTSPDGLMILSDKESVLRRVHELIETMEAVETVTWICQLYLTRGVIDEIRKAGVDFVPAGEVGVTFATAAEGLSNVPKAGLKIDTAFAALLRAEYLSSKGHGVASPLIVMGDGQKSRVRDGRTIPVILRTASATVGTVTSDVEFVKVGTSIEASCREVGDDRGRLQLEVELSEVEQIVDGVPYVRDASGSFAADVRSGEVYLLGRLESLDNSITRREWFAIGDDKRQAWRDLEIWCRVCRVGSLTKGFDHAGKIEECEEQGNRNTADDQGQGGGKSSEDDSSAGHLVGGAVGLVGELPASGGSSSVEASGSLRSGKPDAGSSGHVGPSEMHEVFPVVGNQQPEHSKEALGESAGQSCEPIQPQELFDRSRIVRRFASGGLHQLFEGRGESADKPTDGTGQAAEE